jgi:di/tricarboxylate transporter
LSIHVIGIIGLVIVFVLGTARPINLGAVALVMTFLVGAIFADEGVREMYAGFPVDLFVLLAGVTYLFAVASNNGTVERIIEGAARLVKDRRALIPWIFFIAASLPAMAGAIGSAGVAMLAPLSLRLAERYGIDRRMIGLMVIYGAGAGNFSPLNVLGVIVAQAVTSRGLQMSSTTLFVANLVYNTALAAVIFVLYGGLRLVGQKPRVAGAAAGESNRWDAGTEARSVLAGPPGAGAPGLAGQGHGRLHADHICTLLALMGVAVAALGFGLNIGLLAFSAAVLLQLIFPKSSAGADRKIAWSVVLLVCGIITYVAALQRYGTVQVVGDGIAELNAPLVAALLICVVGAVTSAFASSVGIIAAMIPLATPFMARGEIGTTGVVVALAISATVVDATPFSTVGALVVANADEKERPEVYRGLMLWGAAMIVTAPLLTWLIFIVLG